MESTPKDSLPYQDAKKMLEAEPEIPHCLQHIWGWFWELHQARGAGFNGPLPLSYTEIQAWIDVKGIKIWPCEIGVIKEMDAKFMEHVAKKQKENEPKQPSSSKGKKK